MGERPYKRPESVLIVVHSRAAEVLLLRRVQPPGFWQSVTGSLRWDETPRQAAERELIEETGIAAEPVDCGVSRRFPIAPAWQARFPPDTTDNTEHWFSLCLDESRSIRLSPHEHSDYLWLPASQAALLATSWTNRQAIEHCVIGRVAP